MRTSLPLVGEELSYPVYFRVSLDPRSALEDFWLEELALVLSRGGCVFLEFKMLDEGGCWMLDAGRCWME
jgi:hypothetical protein